MRDEYGCEGDIKPYKQRVAFERHLLNIAPMDLSRSSTGEYLEPIIEVRWDTWQAAQTAMQKELHYANQKEDK